MSETIEAVVDVLVTEKSNISNVLGNVQVCLSYGRAAKTGELYDSVMNMCKEGYGDENYYRIMSIMKWN